MIAERLRCLLASTWAAVVAAALALLAVGLYVARIWRVPPASVIHDLSIAAPFAVFFLDRLFPRPPRVAALALDLTVIALALLRVVAPPLPFVSGHTLFTAYAAATARRWPLRLLAAVVLLQVIYVKLFVARGVASLVAGLAAAAAAAWLRRRLVEPNSPCRSPPPGA